MNTEDRITRARIQLQRDNPFWAYLSLYLKFQEIEKGKMMCDTIGIDIKGNVFYVKEFVDGLSDDELKGVIAHELGHLIYLTELRQGSRNRDKWNCATDLCINFLLKSNNFKLPKDCLSPDCNDNFEIKGIKTIEKISEKTAEEIYDLFPEIEQKGNKYIITSGKSKGEKVGEVLDVHIKGSDGKELSEEEKRELTKSWLDKVEEGYTIAKMKGDIPSGIERLISNLHQSKVNWKALLLRYVQSYIPKDYCYTFPSKKSIASQIYLPSTTKECMEIYCCIDLSGSIGQEELNEFLSEIVGIARAFRGRIKFHLWTHETSVNEKYIVENGDVKKILGLKLHGNGGTSHKDCFDKLAKERDCKVGIFFTDGLSDIEEGDKPKYPVIWVVSKNGAEDSAFPFGKIIKLK